MDVSVGIQVDFTNEWYEGPGCDLDSYDAATDDFLNIPGVRSVCLDHRCWINADLRYGADQNAEVERLKRAVQKVIDEYRA